MKKLKLKLTLLPISLKHWQRTKSFLSRKLRPYRSYLGAHIRIVILGTVLVASLAGISLYRDTLSLKAPSKTYYVAYIGRYARPGFDQLHERALQKYLDELNQEMSGVRLELRTFNNGDTESGSQKAYEEISRDERFLVVVDNTWGRHLKSVATFISANNIPVISINADKQNTDFKRRVVFIGYDDDIPKKVVSFSRSILETNKVIFITETNYALTTSFIDEFNESSTSITRFDVSSSTVNKDELARLLHNLDSQLAGWDSHQGTPTLILNTHGEWGNKIIKYIDDTQKGINIVGGPYIVDWANYNHKFGLNNRNRLIIFTYPHDAVIKKVHTDLKDITSDDSEVGKPNELLFVKRCLDAVSIIRGAFIDETTLTIKPSITRKDVIDFFRDRLAGNQYTGTHDLYTFDKDLLLEDQRTFEEYFQGQVFSYRKQLNAEGTPIPNVYFGLDNIEFSNIDIKAKTFHADFLYWLSSDRPGLEKYIQFLNKKAEPKPEELPILEPNAGIDKEAVAGENAEISRVKVYKVSGDFSMDVDLSNYPLEAQELKIEFIIINPKADDLRISFDHTSFQRSRMMKQSLDEWDSGSFYVTRDFIGTSPLTGGTLEDKKLHKFQTVNMRMPIYRRWTGPFVTIILPLVVIGFAAVALLYVKDSSFSNEGQICVGIFLSIVTYSISFAQITPRANVLTIADMLFYGTFLTVLLVFLKVILLDSSIVNRRFKNWMTKRSVLIGHLGLATYCLMIIAILLVGLV